METITWQFGGKVRRARIPAHVLPFVEAAGLEKAAALIEALGGTEVAFARTARNSAASAIIGAEAEAKLADDWRLRNKVPLASGFLILFLRSQGLGTTEIAKRVRRDVGTVRKTLGTVGEEIGDAE